MTNTAAVGGAGITLALKLLNGETVTATPGAKPNTVLLDPQLLDNLTDAGKTGLKAWVSVPGMDPLWPLSLAIPDWTTYDPHSHPELPRKGAGRSSPHLQIQWGRRSHRRPPPISSQLWYR